MIVPSHELMPIIRAALERGQRVRLSAKGSSMMPFICDGDVVELEPIRVVLARGDIVLAQSTPGYYVLHRIVHLLGDSIWMRGDMQAHSEGPLPLHAVLGRAVTTSRNGRIHALDRGCWHLAGLVWVVANPLGHILLQFALALSRLARRVQRKLQRLWKQV